MFTSCATIVTDIVQKNNSISVVMFVFAANLFLGWSYRPSIRKKTKGKELAWHQCCICSNTQFQDNIWIRIKIKPNYLHFLKCYSRVFETQTLAALFPLSSKCFLMSSVCVFLRVCMLESTSALHGSDFSPQVLWLKAYINPECM